ncbi:MAG: RIP metalloprotease RseP, partial [Candidatus Muiribacteriaceae bacterium]
MFGLTDIFNILQVSVSFLFVIFVIVLIHELGHFIVAKLSGIKVKEFSIGFGPKVYSYQYGETEYVIRPIPLGGFVDLYGMDEESMGEDKKDWERSFVSKPAWKRFSTLLAGPFMNYVLSFTVLFCLAFFVGGLEPLYSERPAVVVASEFVEGNGIAQTPASKAGLETGDEILSVNGEKVSGFEDLEKLMTDKRSELKLEVLRNDSKLVINLPAGMYKTLMDIGIFRGTQPVIGEITPGQEAASKGIIKGDRILRIDNTDIIIWEQASGIIHKSLDKEIELSLEREDEIVNISVVPRNLLGDGR